MYNLITHCLLALCVLLSACNNKSQRDVPEMGDPGVFIDVLSEDTEETQIGMIGIIGSVVDAYNNDGPHKAFIMLDTLIINPRCDLVKVIKRRTMPKSAIGFEFEIEGDSSLVTLMLLNKDKTLLDIFFSLRLRRGQYIYFDKDCQNVRRDGVMRDEGTYFYLLRVDSREYWSRLVLLR